MYIWIWHVSSQSTIRHGTGEAMRLLTRRLDVLLGAASGECAFAALASIPAPGRAPLRFSTRANVQPMPIALPDFLAGSLRWAIGARISQIITANRGAAACFSPIDPDHRSSRVFPDTDVQPAIRLARHHAQALVTGAPPSSRRPY